MPKPWPTGIDFFEIDVPSLQSGDAAIVGHGSQERYSVGISHRYRADFYAQAHPVAEDVILVIEVADSSLAYDREEKLPRYAQANIAEVWIIDLHAFRIEHYQQPRNGHYLTTQVVERGAVITASCLPDLHLALDELFI